MNLQRKLTRLEAQGARIRTVKRLAEQRAAAASVRAKFAALVASNPLSEEPDAEAQAQALREIADTLREKAHIE